MNNLEFCFISSNENINIGSYRIWVYNLNLYLQNNGFKSRIVNKIDELNENTVIILSKSDIGKNKEYREKFPNNLLGLINPSSDKKYNVDFIIVGSIEEKDSLSKNKNIILYPLVESDFIGIDRKIHVDKGKEITLCFQGSFSHLSKFDKNLKLALEELDKEYNVTLKILTNVHESPNWKYGRPNIKNIKIIQWDMQTISAEILSSDIGLIPNITDSTPFIKKINHNKGLYATDYFLRMKNKSNAGRLFIFIQHGVPCIADLTPSNLHILGDPNNGYAVFSKDGWLNAVLELVNFKHRNEISCNAYNMFEKLYNLDYWRENFLKNIRKLKEEHNE